MNIVIIGTGYVGLVTGLGFAKLGHQVACVDIDSAKISRLDMGEPPFFEAGLKELLMAMQEVGKIVFTTDLSPVLGSADIVMIAVWTPAQATGDVNLSSVFGAAETIGRWLNHEVLIVVKSTVPVGTNRLVLERVRNAMVQAGRGDKKDLVTVASVPEFLAEGRALEDFFHPARIVIGADDEVDRQMLDRLHDGIVAPRVFMSIESAELAKYAANAFLATKISFINEIANLAERVGADVRDIVKSIGLDPRIGPHFLRPGIGYGGSCFPKDVSGLHQLAGNKGYHFKLLSSVIEVNNRQRELFMKRVEESLGVVKGRAIAVWGLAFKGETDDVRESAAIDIVERLFAKGAEVAVFDPQAMGTARKLLSDRITFAPTAIDAASGAEALLVLTDWPEFRDVSFETLRSVMLEPVIFDGRNLLADKRLDRLGFSYHGVGFHGRGYAS